MRLLFATLLLAIITSTSFAADCAIEHANGLNYMAQGDSTYTEAMRGYSNALHKASISKASLKENCELVRRTHDKLVDSQKLYKKGSGAFMLAEKVCTEKLSSLATNRADQIDVKFVTTKPFILDLKNQYKLFCSNI